MALAFYVVCVGIGAALSGVYVHHLLGSEGYIPDFDTGLIVASSAAAAFCAVQFAYLTVVRLVLPTRDRVPYFFDGLSNLAFLILLPFVFDMPIPAPEAFESVVQRAAPLVYLGAACAVHAVAKLISFFAFTSGRPGPRWPSVLWAAACAACLIAARAGGEIWFDRVENLRPLAPDESGHYRAGDMIAQGRILPEGAAVAFPLARGDSKGITVRWTLPPDYDPTFDDDTSAFVFFYFTGDSNVSVDKPISLRKGNWVELRLGPDEIPAGATSVQVVWTKEDEGPWQKLTGLSPVVLSNRALVLSGPYQHEVRLPESPPNFIVVAVDGLGTAQTGRGKYELRVSPAIDRLASSLPYFPYTYTPAPEGPAAAMTLLSGVGPLRHGYRGGKDGRLDEATPTLAELLRAHGYTTAAFTEGDGAGGRDMVYGHGWERGFESYDGSYWGEREDPTWYAGSQYTLDKVRRWVDVHQDVQFFAFVRLRELTQFAYWERYGTALIPTRSEPTPEDVYDASLSYLDNVLGAFIKHIRDYETRRNTVVVLVGTYGLEFVGAAKEPEAGLMEHQLRVPLVMYGPTLAREERTDLIALEDIPASLATLAELKVPPMWEGRDFIAGPSSRTPISIMGDPIAGSIRNETWRCVYDPSLPERDAVQLYDQTKFYSLSATRDLASRYPQYARDLLQKMSAYVDASGEGNQLTLSGD